MLKQIEQAIEIEEPKRDDGLPKSVKQGSAELPMEENLGDFDQLWATKEIEVKLVTKSEGMQRSVLTYSLFCHLCSYLLSSDYSQDQYIRHLEKSREKTKDAKEK